MQPMFPKPTSSKKAARPLRRRTPLRRTNPKRRAARYERNFGHRGAAVREMECLLRSTNECCGRVQAAHVVARGMGGVKGDRFSLVPFCEHHHDVSGRLAPSDFARRYNIDLKQEAARVASDLTMRGIP